MKKFTHITRHLISSCFALGLGMLAFGEGKNFIFSLGIALIIFATCESIAVCFDKI